MSKDLLLLVDALSREKNVAKDTVFLALEMALQAGIVAVARRLIIALWRYVAHGVIPEGAGLKPQAA